MDLIIEALIVNVLSKVFKQPLFPFTPYLGRHPDVVHSMGSRGPMVAIACGVSLHTAVGWLIPHRVRVTAYCRDCGFTPLPRKE